MKCSKKIAYNWGMHISSFTRRKNVILITHTDAHLRVSKSIEDRMKASEAENVYFRNNE